MNLSIIVPIYNAEAKLHILLDSIVCSKLNFELICINDGSKDNSVDVLQSYNDSRIKIFTKENEGTFKAWQYGLEKATREYVTILDQDDYVDPDYLSYINEFIEKINADVLFTPYYVQQESGEKIVCNIGLKEGLYIKEHLDSIRNALLGARVPYAKFTKIIRKIILQEQVKQTYQGKISDFEDWLTMVEVFGKIQSLYVHNRAYYHYIQYSNSVSKSTISYKRNLESLMKIINFLENNFPPNMSYDNYKSFCFYGLNCILNKSIAIEEWDLVDNILNMELFHRYVLKSEISLIRKFIFYTKITWVFKLYIKRKNKLQITENRNL